MPISLSRLLQQAPAEVEKRVKTARDQSRALLRDALRVECRLVMRTRDDADERGAVAQIAVEVAPGYPSVEKRHAHHRHPRR